MFAYLSIATVRIKYIPGMLNILIKITITILDIIHHPVFYLKHDVAETGLSPSSSGTYSVGTNKESFSGQQ
jgi:hypothetical protein